MISRKFHFSKKKLAEIPTLSSQVEYTDSEESSLKVVVYPTGRKRYLVRASKHGKKYMEMIGTFPYVPLPTARQKAREFKSKVECDEMTGSKTMKFVDFVNKIYLPEAKEYKDSATSDMSKMSNHLLPRFGNTQLGHVGRLDITNYHIHIKKKLCAATANRHLSLLKAVFRTAVQYRILSHSPAAGIPSFKENNKRDRRLSLEEGKAFLKSLNAKDPRNREQDTDLLALLLWTGLRVSEAMSLKRSQIEDEANSIWLPKTKSGEPRRVFCSQPAKEILLRRLAVSSCDYLFPNTKNTGPMSRPTKCFRRVCTAAGIKYGTKEDTSGLRIHDLRRSAASFSKNAPKGDPYATATMCGHESMQTHRRYAHVDDQALRQAADNIVDVLLK